MGKTLQERIDSFLEGYNKLSEEHKVDLVPYPVYIPDGQGGFKTIIQSSAVDRKDQPVPSSFIPEK